ncbi:hypothetical protein Y032_0098g3065 [Ancylostoma ceylanicum]|uniref:CCHC-type domain-containing protein n=2 Tax=Ancylostoma ceylanicum TaxID=53326 RepID=A0A016TJ31_9BILA|nr:hypothetical protein Y032_0098g3065 [Ancylostoma ceylanicum]
MLSHPGFSAPGERLTPPPLHFATPQLYFATTVFRNMDEDNQMREEAPEPVREEIVDNGLRLDPRDLQMIVEAVRSETVQSSQPCSSSTPVFKREGFARQYEFNTSIIRKLVPLQGYEGIGFVITDIIQELNSRNETLKIADTHPEVFQFLVNKNKSDLLKITDPRLSEFLETIKKKDEDGGRKRKAPMASQPFPKREAAWPPASLFPQGSYAGQQSTSFEDRSWQKYGYQQSWPGSEFQHRTVRPQYQRRDASPIRRFSESRHREQRDYERKKSQCKYCGREGHWWRECPKRN